MRCIWLILLLLLPACESERKINRKLTAELRALEKECEVLQKQYHQLRQEQDKCFHRGAKERFPWLISIQHHSNFEMNYEYIRRLALNYDGRKTISVKFDFKTLKNKIKPKFYIFFYDAEGLLLGARKVNWWIRKLKAGQLTNYSIKVSLVKAEMPSYFRVKMLKR